MIIPIKCMTCGHVLADKWVYYEREVKKLEDEPHNESDLKNMDTLDRGKILDALGLKRICCRRHMLGNQDMMDLI